MGRPEPSRVWALGLVGGIITSDAAGSATLCSVPSKGGEPLLSSGPGEDCATFDDTVNDTPSSALSDAAEPSAMRSNIREEEGVCCDSLRALCVDKVGELCQTAFLLR